MNIQKCFAQFDLTSLHLFHDIALIRTVKTFLKYTFFRIKIIPTYVLFHCSGFRENLKTSSFSKRIWKWTHNILEIPKTGKSKSPLLTSSTACTSFYFLILPKSFRQNNFSGSWRRCDGVVSVINQLGQILIWLNKIQNDFLFASIHFSRWDYQNKITWGFLHCTEDFLFLHQWL